MGRADSRFCRFFATPTTHTYKCLMKTPESEVIAAAEAWAESVPLTEAHELPQELLALWVAIRKKKQRGFGAKPLAKCNLPRSA